MTKVILQTKQNVVATMERKFTQGELSTLMSCLNNIKVKLGEASGEIAFVEIQMRLICQLSELCRVKLAEIIENAPKKTNRKKYWECDPNFLANAIEATFQSNLDSEERELILKFPTLRAKLLHGELIGLMEKLGIKPTGRQITIVKGQQTRNVLESNDIAEGIKSIERNSGLEKVRQAASTVAGILNRIVLNLGE